MKFLIWFFCFFVLAVVQMLFKDAGIILGGIPTLILAGLAFWSKDKLCAAWDRHKANKAADVTVAGKHAAVPTAAPSKPKARFCKLCGDPIDPVTRKCTGCKKQYFRLPVLTDKHYFIAATAVACVMVVLLLFTLVSQRSSYEAEIAKLNTRISELEDEAAVLEQSNETHSLTVSNLRKKNTELENRIDALTDENRDLSAEIRFYDDHIVFIGDDGTRKYHNYDCPYLDLSYFWAYNTENAVKQGYKACSHCCD